MIENINIRLGIVEYRNIITAIKSSYNIDLTDYALTSLKRRFEKVISIYNFRTADELIEKINTDTIFFENFLREISVETTEMYRDPSMWQELKEKILNKCKDEDEIRIWLPDVTTDDELYTLVIVLKEAFLWEKSKIFASTFSTKNIERIGKGVVDLKKMETNVANYRRANGTGQITDYFVMEEKRAVFNVDLLKNVVFLKHNLFQDKAPVGNFKIVIFRNRMLYYNPQLQSKAIDAILEGLLPGGFLIIGINESIDCCSNADKFHIFNANENIYKRVV